MAAHRRIGILQGGACEMRRSSWHRIRKVFETVIVAEDAATKYGAKSVPRGLQEHLKAF